ncbi:Oxidoreductase-like domain-containing protein [Aphelenchoides bicaudatus]|nr:Oxidoreductase-like domain-containing protein [Aphelenchoides bicaudatus]
MTISSVAPCFLLQAQCFVAMFKLLQLRPFVRHVCAGGTNSSVATAEKAEQLLSLCPRHPFPEAPKPELCCGSGCYNCVWIQYADEVAKYFDDHPAIERTPDKWDKIKQLLDANVPDPNLKTYLAMEMEHKFFS